MRLFKVIDAAIAASGLTKAEIARRAGVSGSQITRVGDRTRSPSVMEVARLEEALGLDPGTILTRAGLISHDPTTVVEALQNDPTITPDVRHALTTLYAAATAEAAVAEVTEDYALAADRAQGPTKRGRRTTRPSPPAGRPE